MVKCNQICPWNYYEIGCKKPENELCPMSNLARKEKPKTKADRIRAMSDEELADFITSRNRGICTDICREMYYQSSLVWLKQPTE